MYNGEGVFRIRTQTYKGRGKAVGHVIGRLITLIYALLKQDDETLSHLPPGTQPLEPVLYDPELHRHHRAGHYQPLRKNLPENRIVLVQPKPALWPGKGPLCW